jgi:hypothetical protein
LGKTRKTNNMRNFKTSKSNFYVSKDDKDVERPFTVVECASRRVITRCETRNIAEGIAKFQNKTPTFGNAGFPDFLKE